MTLRDYIRAYEAKTEPFVLEEDYTLLYAPHKGFITYKVAGDALILDHCCTVNDIHWIQRKGREVAREHHCRWLVTQTMRSPRAFLRQTHAHLDLTLSGYRPNGIWYWVFIEEVPPLLSADK